MNRCTVVFGSLLSAAMTGLVSAQPVIYASGQLLIPGDPSIPPGQPGHDDSRKNYVYEINVLTGVATAVSPVTTGLPAALAGTADQQLLGFSSGQLVNVDPLTASRTNIGSDNGFSSTAFDITDSGQAFILPFDSAFNTQQLHSIDLSTGAASAVGSATSVGDAIDLARGTSLGSATPFMISLGSVGNTLYGVDLDTASLVAVDSLTGTAEVVGLVGAVGDANGGGYSGFSALTGVDEDMDGAFDALFGAVNFFDDDADSDTPNVRLGGVARYDLDDGTWSLVGTNPGVIFFGFGSSPIPAPGTALALAAGGLLASRRRR